MNIKTARDDRRVHTASVREEDLHRLVLQAVADQADVDLQALGVTSRVYTTRYTEGSLGTSKPEIVVEIIEDFTAMPGAAA